MAKKTQNLKPDTILKSYWSSNEQFADLFNAVLFHGQQIILPQELEEMDSEESTIFEHRKYAESLQASRDGFKIFKKASSYGIQLVLLGLENQERIHYAMPLRIMGLDYGAYKKQYDSNAKKYTASQDLDSDEYLSRMKRTDRFLPVITIVVYYGEKTWDGAKSLHEMLRIPQELAPFVNDYRMLLVEAGQQDLPLHNTNNIDLFNLLRILLDKNGTWKQTKENAIHYAKEHTVDRSVVMTAAGAANCSINYHALDKEGAMNMYSVFEEMAKEMKSIGREAGLKEGHKAGLEEGLIEGQKKGEIYGAIKAYRSINIPNHTIAAALQDTFHLSQEAAESYLSEI